MNRFLIVRLGALGDIVHALPVAAGLRRAFPGARIDWLVSAKHRTLLDLVPVLDRRLVIGGTGFAPSGLRDPSSDLFSTVRELRRGQYDVAFDVQGLLKSALLARSSGAGRVIGFSSRYLRERLARPLYTEVHDPGRGGAHEPGDAMHVVRLNLGLLEAVGLTVRVPEFPIERVDTDLARHMRERIGGRYALLNPGGGWPNKRWPPERLGTVARSLRHKHRLKSLVLWGSGEESLAEGVVSGSAGAAEQLPPTTIADLVALARGAALLVSGDTGPLHIAAAVGTPIVGIYGPTRPARNGPWSARDVTVSRDAICECHHLRRCRRDTMCLLDIDAGEVIGASDRRLAAEPTRV